LSLPETNKTRIGLFAVDYNWQSATRVKRRLDPFIPIFPPFCTCRVQDKLHLLHSEQALVAHFIFQPLSF